MPLGSRLQDIADVVSGAVSHGAHRAQRATQRRRLRSQIRDEERRIGRLLFPLLAEGALEIELPEVHAAVTRIALMNAELESRRAAANGSGDGDVPS